MQVIGTAGHVDHGKSTLINRLTGINPDRLKEEQDREMSIELGFAWFKLPNDQEVGIVDVPGHRDFIENMLAGIGGIDAALFVVAADEGVMPQTREHLAILDLLQIPAGVVALTKVDLVRESEWLDLVEADLSETLADTILKDAPIVRVSARTGTGIDEITQALQDVLTQHPHRPDLGRPRLPVDRVFTLPGFGTVVTGTLMDGQLAVGDAVEILPRKLEGRIRGLQTHKQKEEKAQPGSRTAVNITGISVDQVQRGDVVVHPETYQATNMMDVWCTLLKDADAPLNHNTEVKLFLGAAEVMARVRLLGVQQLEPGGEAFLQLMLKEPVVALRQDRFIIRRPSPAATIGGGQVIDPHPQHRHKRFNSNRIEELESLLVGTPQEILLQTAQKLGAASAQYLIKGSGLEAKEADEALKLLVDKGVIQELKGKKILITSTLQQQFTDKMLMKITAYHRRFPLRLGMPREQLKSETNLNADVFDALVLQLTDSGKLAAFDAKLRLMEHAIAFTDKQQGQVENLLKQFDGQPYSPPSVKQSLAEIGEELLNALIETGQLIQISEDVLFRSGAYLEMREAVIEHIRDHGEISLAELRDKFDTSRKYAVALLEYLDQTGVTIRKGDNRILRRRS